jgi:hypothetical protein
MIRILKDTILCGIPVHAGETYPAVDIPENDLRVLPVLKGHRQVGTKGLIHLNGQHFARAVSQLLGQGSHSGADFKHAVLRPCQRGLCHSGHQGIIQDKILPEAVPGRKAG